MVVGVAGLGCTKSFGNHLSLGVRVREMNVFCL